MKTRYALLALLIGILLTGGVDAYFELGSVPEPAWWTVSSTIALSATVFAWYYLDSDARSYPRSKWLNVAVVGFSLVAIPYYIFRSTEKERRPKAFLKLAAFVVLCFCCETLGKFGASALG